MKKYKKRDIKIRRFFNKENLEMKLTKEQIKNLNNLTLSNLKIKISIEVLDMMIAFLYKPSTLRTRKTLNNIYLLLTSIDKSMYENDPELSNRYWIILKTIEARISEKINSEDMYINYILDDNDCDEYKSDILKNVVTNKKISYDESKVLIKMVEDRLRYGYALTYKNIIGDYINSIDPDDMKSFKAIDEELYYIANSFIGIHRKTKTLDGNNKFSLDDDVFIPVVTDSVNRLKDRNRIYTTGIRMLNAILSPGYLSKRLYMYLAFPGGGKSQILLKSALDIRKYNKIETKDPDKRPVVLFITLENTIEETVERLFNMTCTNDDIRNYTPKQVVEMLKKDGNLGLNSKNNIDIVIQEYGNREIDTNDLHSIIQDLSDEGMETVALVLDYVKRIRPAEKGATEKEELKNITNELKDLAKAWDIPVITAQQLNRTSATIVDTAMQSSKADLAKLIGRDGVAGAWEIQENSDFVCILNQERKRDTGELFMTFKMIKRRYKSVEEDEKYKKREYFNHPYNPENEIQLIDDVGLDESLSVFSLSSEIDDVSTQNKRGDKNAVERKKKTDIYSMSNFSYEEFDFANG